jgi:multidrug transporter EmrE-like cation transporter
MLLERRSKASQGGAVLLFLGALGCKESVLFLPAVSLLDEGGKVRRDRRAALSIIGVLVALVAVSFFLARTRAAAPAGAAYAIELWPAPLENLMTYTRWCVSLHRALPDLVRSPDPAAYRVALPILVIIVWAGLASRSTHPAVLWGLAWWIFGLLPVLPLRNSTYPHYMYAALPGFMLAVAATLESLATKLWASNRGFSIQRAWPALAIVVVVCYTIRSQDLVSQRLSLRLEGSDLPLDPQIRSMEIAGRAVYSLRDSRWPAHTRLAILSPPGARRVWGARSGHEYALGDNGGAGYDLQRVVLSEGRALRVFFPQLDTVAYVPRWSRSLLGWAIAVPASGGTLAAYGSDAQSYRRLAGDLQQGPNQALAAEFADSLSAALGTE